MNKFNQTIVSLITPPFNSAVSVIRLSGDDSLSLAQTIFSRKIEKPRYAYYGNLSYQGEEIDQVVLIYYKGPNSFTGEDVVEISLHGSMLIVNQVISLFITLGARLAERGEFSSRAFYHHKIDLVQAEGINSLINSTTLEQKKIALYSLKGDTSKLITPLKEKLGKLLANIEVNIDYPEYIDIEEVTISKVREITLEISKEINSLAKNASKSSLVMNGIKVCLVGEPNVGKSSLLNALLNQKKALVSSIPGTTRDVVEGSISLNGLPLHLIDTAGIRESKDEIEKMGIELSLKSLEEADLIIFIRDASKSDSIEEQEILDKLKDKKYIEVFNKSDLVSELDEDKIYISALNNDIEKLKNEILKIFDLDLKSIEPSLFSSREIGLLNKALSSLSKANEDSYLYSLDIVSISLKEAYDCLKDLLGESVNVDLEKEIFSHFCVGK